MTPEVTSARARVAGTDQAVREDRPGLRDEIVEALREVGEAMLQGDDLETLFGCIVSQAAALLDLDAVGIRLLDPSGRWLDRLAAYNLDPAVAARTARVGLDSGLAGDAVRSLKPVVAENVADDPRPLVREVVEAGFVSALVVPLLLRGEPIGTLDLLSRRPRSFSPDEQVAARVYAIQAAIALENARLRGEAREAKEEIEALAEISRELTQSLDLDQVLGLILQNTMFLTGADLAYVALTQPDGCARSVAVVGNRADASEFLRVRPGLGIEGVALATGEMQESADYLAEPSVPGSYRALAAAEGVRAVLVRPIRLHGQVVGLVGVARRTAGQFSALAKIRLRELSMSVAIAVENARLYGEVSDRGKELEIANTSLAEALKVKSDFLANISHEIKTPLNSVLGLLRLIMDGLCQGPEEERAFITEANASAEHLLKLINDVLDMARIEAGRLKIKPEPVDLGSLLEDVRALVQGQATAKGLTLTFHPPDPACRVLRADPTRLKQVLLNLVGNGLKFTEQGGIAVRALARPEQGFMNIEVADTGIGIPLDQQGRLFQRFSQIAAGTARKHGGTGLGLAISKHLVEMMGGVITLESRGEGMGTAVTLLLPLSPEEAPPRHDGPAPGSPEVRGPNGAPLILIVENDLPLRDALQDFLHMAGFQTAAAGTADEALEAAGRLRPALLIVDLALPCAESAVLRTGADLVAALTRKPDLKALPAIFFTGAPAEARALLGNLETPLSCPVLEKPVDLDRLHSTIATVLAQRRREVSP